GARPLDRHRRSLRDAHGRRYRNSGGRDRSLALEILETVHVDETGLRERLAHAVDIETELSGGKALSLLVFLLDAALRRRKHLLGLPARHDGDAVVVGDDHVPRVDERPGAHDGNVHRADRRLDRAFRVDRTAPHREVELLQLAHVAAARVDDEAANAARLVRRAEQLAEHAVGVRAAERDDDDIAGLAELY